MGHSHGGLIAAAAGERGILERAGVTGCILASPYVGSRLPTPTYKLLIARLANHIIPWLGVRTGLQPRWITSDPGGCSPRTRPMC